MGLVGAGCVVVVVVGADEAVVVARERGLVVEVDLAVETGLDGGSSSAPMRSGRGSGD